MIDDENKFFPNKLFKRIHGSTDHLKQILCCMHAWNDSKDQNSKTLKDAKNLKKDDGCFQNGMEDRRKSVWVGGWVGLHHYLLMMIF
jgi:hypothetical protein